MPCLSHLSCKLAPSRNSCLSISTRRCSVCVDQYMSITRLEAIPGDHHSFLTFFLVILVSAKIRAQLLLTIKLMEATIWKQRISYMLRELAIPLRSGKYTSKDAVCIAGIFFLSTEIYHQVFYTSKSLVCRTSIRQYLRLEKTIY